MPHSQASQPRKLDLGNPSRCRLPCLVTATPPKLLDLSTLASPPQSTPCLDPPWARMTGWWCWCQGGWWSQLRLCPGCTGRPLLLTPGRGCQPAEGGRKGSLPQVCQPQPTNPPSCQPQPPLPNPTPSNHHFQHHNSIQFDPTQTIKAVISHSPQSNENITQYQIRGKHTVTNLESLYRVIYNKVNLAL